MKTITKNKMINLIDESKSLREIIIKLGLSDNGSSSYTNLKNKILKLGLEIPKYDYYGKGGNKQRINNEEVFCEDSIYPRQSLKRRIIKENIIEYKCNKCNNNGEWNGKKLSLHLDHINGINNDHRIENLRFLCPNCHSQTETYGGRKNKKKRNKQKIKIVRKRKVERPPYKQLINEINDLGYCGTGRKYNVSDNAIRKWKKYYEKEIGS